MYNSYTTCPYYSTVPTQNIAPKPQLSQSFAYPIYPCVPTQPDQNPVSSPQLSPSTQKWIHGPSDLVGLLGDYNASYNSFPYSVDPNVEIVIKGQFPYARYLSFSVIGKADLTIATIPDRELIPDPGSTNPFWPCADWNAKNRNYTLKIRFTAPPAGAGHYIPGAGNNIVYAGTMPSGISNTQGTITLRIYVPSIGYDDTTWGVGYPKIFYSAAPQNSGYLNSIEQTYQPTFNNPLELKSNAVQNKFFFTSNEKYCKGKSDLSWSTLGRASSLIQFDYNDAYIISNELQRDPNKLLFICWKAPTFPDTYHNIGITGRENMRYWSMSFISPVGLVGLYTLADYDTVIDRNGYVNLVISFGAPRPAFVTTEHGFNWIDASHLPLIPLQLFYRNKIVSDNFPYSAKGLQPGATVTPQTMGEYYPRGKYVDPGYFMQLS